VTEADIAEVISSGQAFRSASWLNREEKLQLEDELHRRVIGQDEAVSWRMRFSDRGQGLLTRIAPPLALSSSVLRRWEDGTGKSPCCLFI